jgi:hypothetical protein
MKKITFLIILGLISLNAISLHAGVVIQVASTSDLNANTTTGIVSAANDGDIIELTTSGGTYTWTAKITALTKTVTIRAAAGLAVKPIITMPAGVLIASNSNTSPISITFDGIDFNGNAVATQVTSAKSNNVSPNTGDVAITVNNCYIHNMAAAPSTGLFGYSATGHTGDFSELKITNSVFDGMNYVYSYSTGAVPNKLTFTNCYFGNITYKAINAGLSIAGGITIDHCTFYNCATTAAGFELNIKTSGTNSPSIIKNCLFANRGNVSVGVNAFGQRVVDSPNSNNGVTNYTGTTAIATIYPATATAPTGALGNYLTTPTTFTNLIADDVAYVNAGTDGGTIGYKGYSASTPTITSSTSSLTGFGYTVGGSSTSQSFTVSGVNMAAGVLVTAPANFEVSSDNSTFGPSYTVGAAGTIAGTLVYVRAISGLNAATYSGNVSLTSAGADTKNVSVNAVVVGPIISTSVNTITGLNYGIGNGPSAEKSFTVSSSNLSSDITLSAPANFEISLLSGTGFTSSVTVTQNTSNVPVYVRQIAGLGLNSYSGNIALASTGATTINVAVSGTVGSPIINLTRVAIVISTHENYGVAPVNQHSTAVSGSYLTNDITVTCPSTYVMSTTTGVFTPGTTSLTIPVVNGSPATTTVYYQLAAGLNGDIYTGNTTFTSGSTTNTAGLTAYVDGGSRIMGTDINTKIVSSISGLNAYLNIAPTIEKYLIITGSGLTSDVTITPSAEFEISLTSGSGFSSIPLTVTPNSGSVSATSIYVRLKNGFSLGSVTGTLTLTATNANTRAISLSGTVTNQPTINTSSTSLVGFATTVSSPSTEQSFDISGINLIGDITVTPPVSGYELSLTSGSGFGTTPILLTQTAGSVANTTIYVRMPLGLAEANYPASINLTSSGATTKTITLSGVVGPATGFSNTNDNILILVGENKITLSLNNSVDIELFTVTGILIDKKNAVGEYSCILNRGAYIIRINGKSTKFLML